MQNGPYVTERLLPQMIHEICNQRRIDYQAFSDDWVLRLQRGGTTHWVVGYTFDINRSGASTLARDKVGTYMALRVAGISAVEHYLVRAVPHDPQEWGYAIEGLPDRDGPVVIKPLDGSAGRGVERCESTAEALEVVRHKGDPAWAICPHYDLTAEYRLVMLGDELLVSFEKTQPAMRGLLKLFNLGHGAVAVDIADAELLTRLKTMATAVMQTMTLGVASVDIVRTADDELRVLEVNSAITLEHYARQSESYEQRAAQAYDAIVQAMFG